MKTLIITNDYPPVPSGISTLFYNLCRGIPQDRVIVLTPREKGYKEFDKKINKYFNRLASP